MTDTLIAWPFDIDWAGGYTETLEWKTAVVTSETGAQQRYSVRSGPRRILDLPFTVWGEERAYFDVMMMANANRLWYAPLPHDTKGLPPVFSGQTTFDFDTVGREYDVGGHVILRSRDSMDWIVLEITSVSDTGITTATGSLITFPRGCTITPAVQARITDMTKTSRPVGRAMQGTVRFTAVEPMYWPVAGRSMSTVQTYTEGSFAYPLLTREPNAVDKLDYNYEWLRKMIDPAAGLPHFTDRADRVFTSQGYSWFLAGAQARSDFRDLMFTLRGRAGAIWVPTFNDDVSPGFGFINPGGRFTTITGRTRAAIFKRDGTVETGTVGPAVGGITPEIFDSNVVSRISFLSLKRLDQDSVEFNHQSGNLTTVKLTLSDAPDLRTPLDAANLPFGHGTSGITNPESDLTTPVTITRVGRAT